MSHVNSASCAWLHLPCMSCKHHVNKGFVFRSSSKIWFAMATGSCCWQRSCSSCGAESGKKAHVLGRSEEGKAWVGTVTWCTSPGKKMQKYGNAWYTLHLLYAYKYRITVHYTFIYIRYSRLYMKTVLNTLHITLILFAMPTPGVGCGRKCHAYTSGGWFFWIIWTNETKTSLFVQSGTSVSFTFPSDI